jgi:hypothetical protein
MSRNADVSSGEADDRWKPQGHVLVEIDNEYLVIRDHIRELLTHASAIVDNAFDGNRSVFAPEQPDGLPNVVFVDLKILLGQIRDEAALPVAYARVQLHQVHVHGHPIGSQGLTLKVRPGLRCRAGDKERLREHHSMRDRPRPAHET